MFVKRTTYNAMKREKDKQIQILWENIDSLTQELAACRADVDDSNEELAGKLTVARMALISICEQKTKRPNATVTRIMEIAEEGLDASK